MFAFKLFQSVKKALKIENKKEEKKNEQEQEQEQEQGEQQPEQKEQPEISPLAVLPPPRASQPEPLEQPEEAEDSSLNLLDEDQDQEQEPPETTPQPSASDQIQTVALQEEEVQPVVLQPVVAEEAPNDPKQQEVVKDEVKEEHKLESTEDLEVEEKEKEEEKEKKEEEKEVAPAVPVTFNFVGVRPTKSHEEEKQTSTKLLDCTSTTVTFSNLCLTDSVRKLKQCIAEEFEIPTTRSLLVLYGHLILQNDDALLTDVGLTDHSYLMLAIHHNDNAPEPVAVQSDEDEKKRGVSPVPRNAAPAAAVNGAERTQRERQRLQRDMDAVRRRLERIQAMRSKRAKFTKSGGHPNQNKTLKDFLKELEVEYVNGFDVIMQQNDVECIKLPFCGHSLHKSSLYQYSLSQFMDRAEVLKCPAIQSEKENAQCGQAWDYPLIKSCLAHEAHDHDHDHDHEEEKEEFEFGKLELLAARNVMEMKFDLQRCTGCKSMFYRNLNENDFSVRTECPLCAEEVFCWGCSEKWTEGHQCDTAFRAQTMDILAKCEVKTIGSVNEIPSVRACPKCNQLINHVSACKHIKCQFCKTSFCFVCMKPQENGSWQCGSSSDRCPVHERQTRSLLPKLNAFFQIF